MKIQTHQTMYKEIHPYYYDQVKATSDVMVNQYGKEKDYWKAGDPIVLNLNTIKMMSKVTRMSDDSFPLVSITISEDHLDDIHIAAEEAEQIKAALLKKDGRELENEISRLTAAIRDLWNLLRARLH